MTAIARTLQGHSAKLPRLAFSASFATVLASHMVRITLAPFKRQVTGIPPNRPIERKRAMSPAVGNFVHDLVEMAKAMDTLPQVEAENASLKTAIGEAQQQVQDREIAIFGYKEEIEVLNAKVRSLEVE